MDKLFCCTSCFGNSVSVNELIAFSKASIGKCNYCESESSLILEPHKLRDDFEFLCGIYEESDKSGSKTIIDLLVDDWEIFKGEDKLRSAQLLGHILDDVSVAGKSFIPLELDDITPKEKWIKFCDELVNKFRFFPDNKPDELPELLPHLLEPIEGYIFRARIELNAKFKKSEMGMPPAKLSRGGRANPLGIPYFYAASNQDTAIAETRPHPSNCVSVAKVKIFEELKVVNLINPKSMVSPFKIPEDVDDLLKLRYDVEFLSHLGEVLSKPVIPDAAEIEYLPTQYLCEFIKKASYDGVKFKSSVGNGVNYTLFNDSKLKIVSVSSHVIHRLDYLFKKK